MLLLGLDSIGIREINHGEVLAASRDCALLHSLFIPPEFVWAGFAYSHPSTLLGSDVEKSVNVTIRKKINMHLSVVTN